MDFLLIVVAIGGFVVAIVMLVLASRANRLHAESQVRVETLETMVTGSVLFASSEPVAFTEPFASSDPFVSGDVYVAPDAFLSRHTEGQPALPRANNVDLALNEFADEDDMRVDPPAPVDRFVPGDQLVPSEEPPVLAPAAFTASVPAYPFVITVPAAAGVGRVQVSFDRTRNRSRS